jgi:hypothetical protein
MSKARDMDRLQDEASPEAIALAAEQHGCTSVAYTYNDPTIFLEYAVDVAQACRERDIRSVAVTAEEKAETPASPPPPPLAKKERPALPTKMKQARSQRRLKSPAPDYRSLREYVLKQ